MKDNIAALDIGFSMVIGEFEQKSIAIKGGSQLNIALLNQIKQPQQLIRWAANSAENLVNYLGRFPASQAQLIGQARHHSTQRLSAGSRGD